MALKICQINIKSDKSNLIHLDKFCDDNLIDIALISETWLLNDETAEIINYTIHTTTLETMDTVVYKIIMLPNQPF